MNRKIPPALFIAVTLLVGFGLSEVSAAGPVTVAHGTVTRLTSSTGNLYWTAEALNEFGASSVRVLRASKNNTPGDERVLYVRWAPSLSTLPRLGPIVYANADTWYGYFVATLGGTSQIIRIPLAGGTAATIITSPAGIITDLKTDGTDLYWSDMGGIRRISIRGGSVTTIVSASSISRLGLGLRDVYFAIGSVIQRVPKRGGVATTQVQASSVVSDLYVHVFAGSLPLTTIYWAEENGSVKSRLIGAGNDTTYQGASIGRRASSVGFDGRRILWIDCTAPGNSFCTLRSRTGAVTTNLVAQAGVGSRNLAWDSAQVFWVASGIREYVY